MALGMEVGLSPGDFMLDAGPSPLPKKGPTIFASCLLQPNASAWIKMPLGTEVGLGSGNIVLHGDPAHTAHKGGRAPNFRPIFIVAKWLDGLRCYLVWRFSSAQATLCSMGTQLPPEKKGKRLDMHQDAT